jgi:hypothetical protein
MMIVACPMYGRNLQAEREMSDSKPFYLEVSWSSKKSTQDPLENKRQDITDDTA